MSVMQLAVAAALTVLTSRASAADSAGSAGQCAVAADHVLLQAKSNVHPLKKLSAQAKLVQETNKGDMESKLASKASANSTEWLLALSPTQNPSYIPERFEGECNPQNLRKALVIAVFNIVGGVHESFLVHVEDGSETGLAMMLEVGKSSQSGLEPIFAIRCESMPWVSGLPEQVEADVAKVGNCLSEIGVLPVMQTLAKRVLNHDTAIFADWTEPCGAGDCPCNSDKGGGTKMLRRGAPGEWTVRNAMILPTKTRTIMFPYTSYGKVADLAKDYSEAKFPNQGRIDDYNLATNNCQDFAADMFTKVTGDTVWKAGSCNALYYLSSTQCQ